MGRITLAAALLLGLTATALADGTCMSSATDKKLAGAAKTSFMKKCETDAAKSCDDKAVANKYAGAAKASFTKKCVKDAVGT